MKCTSSYRSVLAEVPMVVAMIIAATDAAKLPLLSVMTLIVKLVIVLAVAVVAFEFH